MHRALCISEILREILLYASEQCTTNANPGFGQLCPWHAAGDELAYCWTSCAYDIETRKGRSTPRHQFLRAVALSCRTFSSVALDLLWRVLDSPEPLRRLREYYIRQGVEPDSLQTCKRYREYTKRVRGIHFGMNVNDPESDDSKLNEKLTKHYLALPRLRSVRIDVAPSSDQQRPLGLLTNSLADVSLTFVGEQSHWSHERASSYLDNYLRSMASQPFLETLELDWVPTVPAPASLTCLAKLRMLRVALRVNIVDALPLLVALHASSIPHIRLFVEQGGCDPSVMEYCRTHVGGPVELNVRGSPSVLCLDRLLWVFATRENETKRELHLTCELEYPDNRVFAGPSSLLSGAAVGALVSALRCPHSTIAMALRAPMDLDLEDTHIHADDEALAFTSIQPLLKIRQMVRFEVAANAPFSLSDTDVAALACAWPDLEALEVRLYHDTLQGSALLPERCPTLRSLVALARHCPRLGALRIPFRAHIDGMSSDDWPKPGQAQQVLKQLAIDGGEVLCGESHAVGVALEDMFPRAMLDTRNVFDSVAWDYIIESKVRHRLYTMMRE